MPQWKSWFSKEYAMKRFLVLPMFAAVLLLGCSTTLHPTITVTAQNGGTSFLITGTGFSSGTPCATLSSIVAGTEHSGGSTPMPIPPGQAPCTGGSFSLTWTPSQGQCTANTPVWVTAFDIPTVNPAPPQSATILCEAAVCPASFPTTSTTMPTYFENSTGNEATNTQGPV